MDSIQQPKNRNRNIGQRDIRFLFRIAAILDGLACPREFFVFILGFLLFFFVDSVPFEAFSQHWTKGIADNVCQHTHRGYWDGLLGVSGSDWSLTNFN